MAEARLLHVLAAGLVSAGLLSPGLWLTERLVEEMVFAERRVAERAPRGLLRAEQLLRLERRGPKTTRGLWVHNLLEHVRERREEDVVEYLALQRRVEDLVLAELWVLELELREGLARGLPAQVRELEKVSTLLAGELRVPE